MTDCDSIRAIINSQNSLPTKGTKVPDSQDKVAIDPLGKDRNNNRIWALDSQFCFSIRGGTRTARTLEAGNYAHQVDSGRLYKSANPFKRPYVCLTLHPQDRSGNWIVSRWESPKLV